MGSIGSSSDDSSVPICYGVRLHVRTLLKGLDSDFQSLERLESSNDEINRNRHSLKLQLLEGNEKGSLEQQSFGASCHSSTKDGLPLGLDKEESGVKNQQLVKSGRIITGESHTSKDVGVDFASPGIASRTRSLLNLQVIDGKLFASKKLISDNKDVGTELPINVYDISDSVEVSSEISVSKGNLEAISKYLPKVIDLDASDTELGVDARAKNLEGKKLTNQGFIGTEEMNVNRVALAKVKGCEEISNDNFEVFSNPKVNQAVLMYSELGEFLQGKCSGGAVSNMSDKMGEEVKESKIKKNQVFKGDKENEGDSSVFLDNLLMTNLSNSENKRHLVRAYNYIRWLKLFIAYSGHELHDKDGAEEVGVNREREYNQGRELKEAFRCIMKLQDYIKDIGIEIPLAGIPLEMFFDEMGLSREYPVEGYRLVAQEVKDHGTSIQGNVKASFDTRSPGKDMEVSASSSSGKAMVLRVKETEEVIGMKEEIVEAELMNVKSQDKAPDDHDIDVAFDFLKGNDKAEVKAYSGLGGVIVIETGQEIAGPERKRLNTGNYGPKEMKSNSVEVDRVDAEKDYAKQVEEGQDFAGTKRKRLYTSTYGHNEMKSNSVEGYRVVAEVDSAKEVEEVSLMAEEVNRLEAENARKEKKKWTKSKIMEWKRNRGRFFRLI